MNVDADTCFARIARIRAALEEVRDPEIPVLSVLDLGVIGDVRADDGGVTVDLLPTFAGCPALDVMRGDIQRVVTALGEPNVVVRVVFDPPWTTERITEEGRRKLKEFGLAPPGRRHPVPMLISVDQIGLPGPSGAPQEPGTPCPYCDSSDTHMESLFGPTLCRSIHYCRACRQSFEHFKSI